MVCVSVCVLVTTMSHANAAEPIECRPDMRGSASPRVMGPSKSADCNQQQEQQQEDAKFMGEN